MHIYASVFDYAPRLHHPLLKWKKRPHKIQRVHLFAGWEGGVRISSATREHWYYMQEPVRPVSRAGAA